MIILSEEEELSRVYTINLSKVMLAPHNRRAKRAINMIKEFATRHMKAEEVKIDEDLNKQMWTRGIRHPPRRVRVKMTKDDDDIVTVSLYSEEAKEEAVEEKAVGGETVTPAMALEKAAEEKLKGGVEAKTEEKVEAPTMEESDQVAEVKDKPKKEKEEKAKEKEGEGEKVVLSEEELADLMTEESGAVEGEMKEEEKKEKPKRKGKGKKTESEEPE